MMKLRDKYPEPDRIVENNPGDYYDNKATAASYWRKVLTIAKALDAPLPDLVYINSRIDMADYTGD
jgi:hypothetical protein